MLNLQRDLSVKISGTERVLEITELHIEHRYEVSAGISPQIQIPFALITLSTSATISQNQSVEIKVTPKSGTLSANWATIGAIVLFRGQVDQVDETVTPFGMRLIQVRAFSNLRRLMSAKVDSTTFSTAPSHTPITHAQRALSIANNANWPPTAPATMYIDTFSGSSNALMPVETLTNTNTGDMIQTAIDCEAGVIRESYWNSTLYSDPTQFWFEARGGLNADISSPPTGGTTGFSTNHVANDPTHFCMLSCEITRETQNQYNDISASLASNSTIYVNGSNYSPCRNNTSISLYGSVPLDISLNYHPYSADNRLYLKQWIDNLNRSRPSKRVSSVTASPVLPDGYINGALVDSSKFMCHDGKVAVTIEKTYPGTTKKSITLRQYYYISGQIHDITPESWIMTNELWGGY